jgi:ribosomal protein S18 acetylase RimI-like enzyme
LTDDPSASEGLSIRPYRVGDREALGTITRVAWSGVTVRQLREERFGLIGSLPWYEHKVDEVLGLADAEPERFVVGLVHDRVVGYASFGYEAGGYVGYVGNNAVHPDFRGRGIGRALVRCVLTILERSDVQIIEVETLVQDDAARHLYESVGFREISRTVRYAMSPSKLYGDAVTVSSPWRR